MQAVDVYLMYCALKAHFGKGDYDFVKYGGKSSATKDSFWKRTDRLFFVKTQRKYKKKQVIQDYLVSNFVQNTKGWLGDFNDDNYLDWKRRTQSLSYTFKEEANELFDDQKVDEVFDCSKGHPQILKSYLGGNTSLETMVICDRILEYRKDFDKRLTDPVWETVSRKIKKYSPFLNIDTPRYKKILKEVIINGT